MTLHKLVLPLNFFLIRFIGCYRNFYNIVRLFREPCHDIWLSHFDVFTFLLCLQPLTQNGYKVGFSNKWFKLELCIQKLCTRFFQFYIQFSKEQQKYSLELGDLIEGCNKTVNKKKYRFVI